MFITKSRFKNLEFSNVDNKITGGYVYKVESKQNEMYGGSRERTVIVPVGLVVNKYDDNIKYSPGEYIGVLGMDKIDEFLNLNHKPFKRITRKMENIIHSNRTKKQKSKNF